MEGVTKPGCECHVHFGHSVYSLNFLVLSRPPTLVGTFRPGAFVVGGEHVHGGGDGALVARVCDVGVLVIVAVVVVE